MTPRILRIADTARALPGEDHTELVVELLAWAAVHKPAERQFLMSELRSVRDNDCIRCPDELRWRVADVLEGLTERN